ncbi:hypothetical protein ACSMX9_24770 [Streptomyces sp. LE64]|uniref:hypothetical protein n=1 Tax=Streptomyces sp. LE64 TaxID=3448653 RepID=UPI004041D601
MTRDALISGPPAESGAHCCLCGRWTTAPVVIGYDCQGGGAGFVAHRVCPQHVATPGSCTANHGSGP